MAEGLLEIISEGRGQKFYKPIDVNTVTNATDDKHNFSCGNIFLGVGC